MVVLLMQSSVSSCRRKPSAHQSFRLRRRRQHHARLVQALPGFQGWLPLGAGLVGALPCPVCRGLATVDIGPSASPEIRCTHRGCGWLGCLPEFLGAVSAGRRAA